MIPLITKFNSSAVLYDSIGSQTNSYISLVYDNRYVYFLTSTNGTTIRFDKITETSTQIEKTSVINTEFTIEESLTSTVVNGYAISSVNIPSEGTVNSIIKYKNSLFAFNGYNAKQFIGDTVLYIKDNNKLVQESYDRKINIVHLSSFSTISDFFIDDNMNYYVIHNKNCITKFSKDRILQYSTTIAPVVSTEFNLLAIIPNDEIEFFKIDYVREYTSSGLSAYPIVLGKIKNGNTTIKPNELFLAKINESVVNTTSQNLQYLYDVTFLGLTGLNYLYGNSNKINYNLTNYDYLKNSYSDENKLIFKIVLQNVYNNRDKIIVEIPISTYLFQSEYHHFAFRLNGIDGVISVFCDGKEVGTAQIAKGQYIFQDIINDSITIGKTYFHNSENLDEHLNQPNYYYVNNAFIKQFKMYKKALSNSEIDYHVYRGIDMQNLVVSLPCDQRNELDGIERQFKLNTSGNKSNKINLIIKNSQITNPDIQDQLKVSILDRLKKVLPITTTINDITFR